MTKQKHKFMLNQGWQYFKRFHLLKIGLWVSCCPFNDLRVEVYTHDKVCFKGNMENRYRRFCSVLREGKRHRHIMRALIFAL